MRAHSVNTPVHSSFRIKMQARPVMLVHSLARCQTCASTQCCDVVEHHRSCLHPSRRSCLHCTALALAHTSCTHMHTHQPSKSLRVLLSSRCLRNPGVLAHLRLLAGGPSTLRRNCRSMPAQVQVGPVSGSCCCQALVARHQRKAQPQESASRCACRRTDAGKTLTRASAAQERMENSENSGKTRKGHCKSKSRS